MILEIVLIELAVALLTLLIVSAWLTYRKFKPVVLNYRDRWHSMERSIVELKIDRDRFRDSVATQKLPVLEVNMARAFDRIEALQERLTKLEAGHSQTEKPVVKPKNWRGVKAELGEN